LIALRVEDDRGERVDAQVRPSMKQANDRRLDAAEAD
jgi:hypothetical protein